MFVDLLLGHPSEERIVVDVHRHVPMQLLHVHLHRVAVLAVIGQNLLDVAAKVLLDRREHLDAEKFAHNALLVWRELRAEERGLQGLSAAHTARRKDQGCR